MGGWSGAAWDPGYFLLAYLSPDYMYSTAWATDKQEMTFTMPKGGENGEDITLTMTLIDWYNALNGLHEVYDWSAGQIENPSRLALIAALEKEILSVYYSVPLVNSYSATLVSYKWEYKTRTYNTFMGYGGIKYITYNYTNAEWTDYVKSVGGNVDYKA
jgi:hypothetical protein